MKGSANYDLAVEFLEYLTRPDIQVKIAKGTGGFIPPVQEAIDYLGDEAIDEVINKAVLVLKMALFPVYQEATIRIGALSRKSTTMYLKI